MTIPHRHVPHRSRRPAWPTAIVCLLLGVFTAFAHARLLRSDPVDKATLTKAPDQISLWFNELLDEGFNIVEVYPADQLNSQTRTNLAEKPPKVDVHDGTHLSAALQPLLPGKYIVDYRVLSRDGHTAPGRVTFTVQPAK